MKNKKVTGQVILKESDLPPTGKDIKAAFMKSLVTLYPDLDKRTLDIMEKAVSFHDPVKVGGK